MAHVLAFVLVLLTVLACSPANPLATPDGWTSDPTLWVTPELQRERPEVVQELVRAADVWCRAGHVCVQVRMGRGPNEARIVDDVHAIGASELEFSVALVRQAFARRHLYILRRYSDGRPITYDVLGCRPSKLVLDPRLIAMHEMGHFIGLDHIEDERSIMHPVTSCDRTLTLPKP